MTSEIILTLRIDPVHVEILKKIAEDIARVQAAWNQMAEDIGLLIVKDDDDCTDIWSLTEKGA